MMPVIAGDVSVFPSELLVGTRGYGITESVRA